MCCTGRAHAEYVAGNGEAAAVRQYTELALIPAYYAEIIDFYPFDLIYFCPLWQSNKHIESCTGYVQKST
jgi:hypothetical protein